MRELVSDLETLKSLQRVFDCLPAVVADLSRNLGEIIKALEIAFVIDREFLNGL